MSDTARLGHLKILVLMLMLSSWACSSRNEEVAVPDTVTASIDEQTTHREKVLLQQEIIRRQEQEMKKQDRELEDLERQKLYNDSLKRFEERSN